MDKNIKIPLGSTKNINDVDVDNYEKVELLIKPSLIHEYDSRNVLSAAEVFDLERNSTPIYRIYGSLEYLSMLNGLKNTYSQVTDFFTGSTESDSYKDIFNSFNFYLLKPSDSGYTESIYTGGTETSIEYAKNTSFTKWEDNYDEYGLYPIGWDIDTVTGIVSISPFVSRRNSQLGLKVTFGDYTINNIPQSSYLKLSSEFLTTYGDIIIETSVGSTDETNESVVDFLNIRLLDGNDNVVYTVNSLVIGGRVRYNVGISSETPVSKVELEFQGSNVALYMSYLRIYKVITDTPDEVYSWDGYVREFDVIATPKDFELFNVGFAKNCYDEQRYAFNFNKDIDISNYFDALGFPITELYLYAKYIPRGTEGYLYTHWDEDGNIEYRTVSNTITDKVYGDFISHIKEQYKQTELEPQIHYIHTPYNDGTLVWKYNPFIPLRLQYLSNELSRANSGTTLYDQAASIPYYATALDDDGNYVWREILDQGYTDPLTGLGVDYPFINKRRYLFDNLTLAIVPDMNDSHTREVFTNIYFTNTIVNVRPIGDINSIGKPCQ